MDSKSVVDTFDALGLLREHSDRISASKLL
jgi:hypothetical protein